MASDNTLTTLLVLGVGGYLLYHYVIAPSSACTGTSVLCKFPDGTCVPMPAGTSSCPYDATHGGQSTPCYPSGFVGPLQPGSVTC
jgi:hypothetical protein